MENAEGGIMKPAFVLLCYLAGQPSGILHFSNIKNADYFKRFLDNQEIQIGEERKKYDCYIKLVKVNKGMRLY